MGFLHFINENNKESLNKPANTDQVYYSELNDWYTNNAFRSFSIKHVLEGSIYYQLGKREFKISKDRFLIAAKQPEVIACFHSRQIVKSVCIDICENSIADALTTLKNEQRSEITEVGTDCLKHPDFAEAIHSLHENFLSDQLHELTGLIRKFPCSSEPLKLSPDWFLNVVELIALFEMRTQTFGRNLPVLKTSTKKEILKRALAGKDFMDA